MAQSELHHRPFVLEREQRLIVDQAIRDVCEYWGWTLHALNVRTNHVHFVLNASHSPEQVMTTLKAWSTRRLREAGLVDADAKLWSRHGSTRYLWTMADIETACRYVTEEQGSDLR
jgi:REP element-mobilizing transposase RayT